MAHQLAWGAHHGPCSNHNNAPQTATCRDFNRTMRNRPDCTRIKRCGWRFKMNFNKHQLVFAFLAATLTAGTLAAQDPPSRVARLKYIQGDVSFQPPSVDDWSPASLNYPLTTGSHIYTANG